MTRGIFPAADKSLASIVPRDTLHNVRKCQREIERLDRGPSRWFNLLHHERYRSPSGGGRSVHPRSGRSAAWVHRFVRTFSPIFQAVPNEFLSRTQIRKDSSDVVVKRSCQLVLRVSNLLDDRIILHHSVPRKALLACISWASQTRPNDTS